MSNDETSATRNLDGASHVRAGEDGDFRRSVAVIIGVDAYGGGIPTLQSAVGDASALAAILAKSHGYTDPILLVDEQATLAGLRELLDVTLPARVGPGDRVIFYFAGHGTAIESEDRPKGFILPFDARPNDEESYLSMDALIRALEDLACRHLLLILDCCFAGAMRWSSTRSAGLRLTRVYREHVERFQRERAWQALVSTAHDQVALDVSGGLGARDGGALHSPFAAALLAALAEDDADRFGETGVRLNRSDGVITLTELYAYLESRLAEATGTGGEGQRPGLFNLKKELDKGEYFFLVPGRTLVDLAASPRQNPYRGLSPFEATHADLFFGRKAETEALCAAIRRGGAAPLVIAIGPSGCGKSSLLNAGVLPALARDEDAPSVLGPIHPGASPLRALTDLPLPGGPSFAARVGARLATSPERLLLVVDALEEVVILASDAERSGFLQALSGAIEAHGERFGVVLILRSAYEAPFLQSPLARWWSEGRHAVAPMKHDELRDAIVGPAWELCLDFESSDLVERILTEVSYMPAALPALSGALAQLYDVYKDRGEDNRIFASDDYRKLGSVTGSLIARAETLFTQLDTASRGSAQRALLRMVGRSVPRSELDYGDEAEARRVDDVLQKLVEARLVVQDRLTWTEKDGPLGNEDEIDPVYMLAGDALSQSWPRFVAWVADEREMLLVRQRLTQAARDWKAGRGGLWDSDPRLLLVEDERQKRGARGELWLNRWESELVDVSARERRAAHDQLMAFLRDQGRSALLNGQPLDAAVSLARTLAEGDASIATKIMLNRALAPVDALAATFTAEAAAFSPDGSLLAVGRADGGVEIWNLDGRVLTGTLTGHASPVRDLTFDPAGSRLVSTDESGVRMVWNARTVALERQLDEEITKKESAGDTWRFKTAFADGGARIVLLWSTDFVLDLYWSMVAIDAVTFAPVRPKAAELGGPYVPGCIVAASADGAKVAVAPWSFNDQSLTIWSTVNGAPLGIVKFEIDVGILGACFSPDAERLAITTATGVEIWTVGVKPARLFALPIDGPWLSEISPDGELLCTVNRRRSADVLDASTGDRIAVLEGHVSPIGVLVFSPDSDQILTAAGDDVRIWDAWTGDLLAQLAGHDAPVKHAAFSPDQRWIVTTDEEGRTRLWAAHPRSMPRILRVHRNRQHWTADPPAMTLEGASPDGRRILLGAVAGEASGDRAFALWDTPSGRLLETWMAVEPPLLGPDGNVVVGSVAPRPIEASGPAPCARAEDGGRSFGSHPGSRRWLVLSRNERRIEVWDTATCTPIATLKGHVATINTATFNTEGSLILTASSDGSAKLWDAATGKLLSSFESSLAVTGAHFLPGDDYAVTLHAQNVAKRWDLRADRRTSAEVGAALRRAGGLAPGQAASVGSGEGIQFPSEDPAAAYDRTRAPRSIGWARRHERAFARARIEQALAGSRAIGDRSGEALALLTLRALTASAGEKVGADATSKSAFDLIRALAEDPAQRIAVCRIGAFAYNELLDRDAAQMAYRAVLAKDASHPAARRGESEIELSLGPVAAWLSASQELADGSTRMAALRWAAGTLLGKPDPHHSLALALWTLYGDPNLPGPLQADEPLDFRGTRFFLGQLKQLLPARRDPVLAVLALLERPGNRGDLLKQRLGLPKGEDFVGP